MDRVVAVGVQAQPAAEARFALKNIIGNTGRLVNYLAGVPDDVFERETRFRRRLRLDTYSHYPIHTASIRAWREKLLQN